MTRRIHTSHVCPPVPVRAFDWCAWDDSLGADASPYGWGATEAEAVADFWETVEESPEIEAAE